MARKQINKTTWEEFIDGRENQTIICPGMCQHTTDACTPDTSNKICWNSYIEWTKGEA